MIGILLFAGAIIGLVVLACWSRGEENPTKYSNGGTGGGSG